MGRFEILQHWLDFIGVFSKFHRQVNEIRYPGVKERFIIKGLVHVVFQGGLIEVLGRVLLGDINRLLTFELKILQLF